MNAYDFDAVAYDGAVYCVDCVSPETDMENDPEVTPIFADSEWDSYPVCFTCNREHDYVNLTTDGRVWLSRRDWTANIREMLAPGGYCGGKESKLPAFTSPGSYPLVYTTEDDDRYCGKCANDADHAFPLSGVFVHYEGDAEACDECGDEIDSAYGPVSPW